ncbi:hypothetical protein [Gordonia westfalica]|uniref:Uncharacterized protein n=1 Tax=Gordonia westfalica TaxID=158898 RepID=A0A1H2LI29_9ACTN|nr:hypothetical protein [Gordonia westfalica]SDU80492.1 hypothetical protein SAMN04488548_136381 [Gordonia westfalica]
MGVGLLLDMVESGLGDRVALGDRASGLTHAEVVATARGGATRSMAGGWRARWICRSGVTLAAPLDRAL